MSKYRARRTTVDGITFDSAGEARRYQELKLMERAGVIGNLKRQVIFNLNVNGIHICEYRADFVYEDHEWMAVTVEDFKGFRTAEYRLKRKLMAACHGIEIRETGAAAKPRRKPARRPLAKQEAA
jgi:hypothetical protein